jgi:hypothetical protein
MASQTGSTSFPLSEKSHEGAHIIARQYRIPAWSFPYLFIAIIGVGFLFTFYDIFDINVSFILVGGYLVVASVLALFGTSTRNKRLDEVSP